MTASQAKLNPFERLLFWLALGLGGLVAAIRLGAIALWYLHH
jgi:hypothetical protein